MVHRALWYLCLGILLGCVAVSCSPSRTTSAKVTRVVDGDTILLATGERVRYIGMDAPEIGGIAEFSALGEAAAEHNRRLVQGREVRLEYDVQLRDRYRRLLAYVFVDTILINARMVSDGFARTLTVPPNLRYSSRILALEREAREQARGLWGDSAAVAQLTRPASLPSDTVYVTIHGKRYHRPWCGALRKGGYPLPKSEAESYGLTPCRRCSREK